MITESISFITVFNKYVLYSEALSQYHTLDEEDQKIVAPYIRYLKERWEEELKQIRTRLHNLLPKKSQPATK